MKGSPNQNFQKGKGFGKGFKGFGKGKGGKGKGGGGLGSMQEPGWGYEAGAWQEGYGSPELFSLRTVRPSSPKTKMIFEDKNMFGELDVFDESIRDTDTTNVFDESIRDIKSRKCHT